MKRATGTGGMVTGPESMTSLVERLRALAGALTDRLPVVDGEQWVHVDAALTCLYGALIELEDLDRVGDPMGVDTSVRPR